MDTKYHSALLGWLHSLCDSTFFLVLKRSVDRLKHRSSQLNNRINSFKKRPPQTQEPIIDIFQDRLYAAFHSFRHNTVTGQQISSVYPLFTVVRKRSINRQMILYNVAASIDSFHGCLYNLALITYTPSSSYSHAPPSSPPPTPLPDWCLRFPPPPHHPKQKRFSSLVFLFRSHRACAVHSIDLA